MILRNKKKEIMSILICIVVTIATFISIISQNNIMAESSGRTYVKYIYATQTFTEYELPAIPIARNDGLQTRAALLPDERKNSPLEQTLVQIGAGTGFIIGEHEILTAAHVLTYLSTKEINVPTVKIPKSNPLENTAINLTPVAATFPKAAYNELVGDDYAILTVAEDLSKYGSVFLGLGVNDAYLVQNNIYALGYKGNYQKISSGKVEDIYEDYYKTSAHIYPGTSGGPVYCQYRFGVLGSTDPEEKVQIYKTVIGIATRTDYYIDPETQIFYSGSSHVTRITPEVLQFAYSNNNL